MPSAKGSARQDPETNKGEQAGYFLHQRALRKIGASRVDLSDPQAIEARVDEYFRLCAADGTKPTMPGLATALGTTWQELSQNPSRTVVMAAQSVLDVTVQMMEDGRIPQAPGIFLLKNWFGYKDSSETSIRITRVASSAEEIRERYANVELVESGDGERKKRRLGSGR